MKNTLTAFFSFCLVVQLVTLTAHVQIPFFEFGATSTRILSQKNVFSYQKQTANLAKDDTVEYQSMVFVGDIMLARNVEYLMNKKGDHYPFSGFDLGLMSPSPAVFGNFEASIPTEHKETPVGSLTFSVKESFGEVLRYAGVSHLSLGNNHSFDYGIEGYNNTKDVLTRSLIQTFGNEYAIDSESITYIDLYEHKIAVLGINLLMPFNKDEINDLVKHSVNRSDIQIAYVHWGEEYDLHHSAAQEKLATLLVDSGIDLIVGHHPHVTQDVDMISGVPVFYSLGNYVFDQYFSKDVQEGLVLALTYKDGFIIDILPVSSQDNKSQPNLMSPDKHVDFFTSLAKKSDELLQESVMRGRINLQESVASSTKMAIINK
jgi:poly-gamma-glutamate synthesis protein (capsule biosynthesis protein)